MGATVSDVGRLDARRVGAPARRDVRLFRLARRRVVSRLESSPRCFRELMVYGTITNQERLIDLSCPSSWPVWHDAGERHRTRDWAVAPGGNGENPLMEPVVSSASGRRHEERA